MSSPYTVSALTCVGALTTNSLNVTTTITTSGALTAPSLTAPAASNLVIKTPAGFATTVGGSTASQAAGETVLFRVAVPTTDITLVTVTAAGSGSGANAFSVVPPAVFTSTMQGANLKVTTSRTFAGQAGYMSWNDDGTSGATFFSNQIGGGAGGGWRWQPVSALDVVGPVVMSLSQSGDLTVAGTSTLAAVNSGAVTSTARVSALYARVIGNAVLDVAGGYVSWDDKTYFFNRETTTGGWEWRGVDSDGVVQPTALTLTHAGALTATAGVSCTTLGATGTSTLATVNCGTVASTARVSALALLATGGAVTETAGAYMSYSDKTYFLNRETTTGGWLWYGLNNAGVLQAEALSLTHAGALTAASRITSQTSRATSSAVFNGQGAYTSWNDDGSSGATFFSNQLGGGSPGGWRWQPVDVGNAATAPVMTLSQTGILSTTSGIQFEEGTYTPEIYYYNGATKVVMVGVGGTETFKWMRLGYNLVRVTIIISNMIYAMNPAHGGNSTVWFGGLPKFGRTIDFDSVPCTLTQAGSSAWDLQTLPSARSFVVATREANGAVAPDVSSFCLAEAGAILTRQSLSGSIAIDFVVTFDYRLY